MGLANLDINTFLPKSRKICFSRGIFTRTENYPEGLGGLAWIRMGDPPHFWRVADRVPRCATQKSRSSASHSTRYLVSHLPYDDTSHLRTHLPFFLCLAPRSQTKTAAELLTHATIARGVRKRQEALALR